MKNAGIESLDLNFPKNTPVPDPLREAIARMEKAGYDVEGLWTQYIKWKWALRTNAEVFRTILDTARAKAAVFGMEDQP